MRQPMHILLAGAGQLGSRHAQALARSTAPLRLTVMDPSPRSLETTRQRLGEIPSPPGGGVVEAAFVTAIPAGGRFDLAILACLADVRAAVTRELFAKAFAPFVVFEKVLFTRLSDYDDIGELLARHDARAWVNCPRRMYPVTDALRELARGPVSLAATGGSWGIGCNSIHFADLLALLTGETDIRWDVSGLDPEPRAASRPGFLECTGTLRGETPGGSRLTLTARHGEPPAYVMTMETDAARVELDEAQGRGSVTTLADGVIQDLPCRAPYQSELTHLVAAALREHGDCPLTPYAESATLHLALLRALLGALGGHLAQAGRAADEIPVT